MQRSTTHKRKLVALYTAHDQLHALLVFTRRYDRERRQKIGQARVVALELTNRQLDIVLAEARDEIAYYRAALKPRKPLNFYVDLLRDAKIDPDKLIFIPRWQLNAFFAGINDVLKGLTLHPQHTLVSFDLHGIHSIGTPGEVRILEAALYEDMCAQFNRAADLTPKAALPTAGKALIKECAAVRRGAVLAAFYLVEAYLNSIAFDYLLANAEHHMLLAGPVDTTTAHDPLQVREQPHL